MDQIANDKNKRLLEELLKDPSKKLLSKDKIDGATYYEFQEWVKDLPEERRRSLVRFTVYKSGEIYVFRSKEKRQKFLCVGGPLAAQKSTEDDATEYIVFNCGHSDGGLPRDKKIPRVILVHRSAWTDTGKSRYPQSRRPR